ncbi:MAG TPA: hypothetical protein VFQ32_06165 [Ktedonobacterales bacterium]|nr:hypothetical protein [Ktedonobacterales bacterium]
MASSSQSSRRSRRTVPLEDLAFQERDSVFRAPGGGDWMLLGLVAAGLLGTGLYDWVRLGVNDPTGRAVFFGLLLVAIYWGALVYIFKLSMCVLVGPHGLSLVRGPWRTELFWRDTARLVERTEADNGQRYRWVVAMARDGRELRVREDMVINYMRFRAEVYERYLLWRDHGGTWGASGNGPFVATDIVSNTVAWWLFAGGMALLPGLYCWFLLPGAAYTGLALVAITALCCLEALLTFLGRQTYSVGPKEITRKRPAQPTTHLRWRNVSRIERTRHPAGGLIRVGIGIGRLLMAMAARTDGRFKSFAWTPRVPEYLTLRGEGRHVRVRLHRLSRPDEILAWVEYYERVGRRQASQSRPADASQPGAPNRPVPPTAPIAPDNISMGVPGVGPADPWASGPESDLPADAYPTAVQPSVSASRPSASPFPGGAPSMPKGVPPRVAAEFAAAGGAEVAGEDTRAEADSWLWDTSKMPSVSSGASSPDIFGQPAGRPSARPQYAQPAQPTPYPQHADPESLPTAPAFTPPPTAGPVFNLGTPAATETPWWMNADAPAEAAAPAPAPSWDEANGWGAGDIYPPAPDYSSAYPPAYPQGYHAADDDQMPDYVAPQPDYGQPYNAEPDYPQRMPPFVAPQDYPPPEPPEEQGPSERELYDENLADSQKWRAQKNWQSPQLPRFGPPPQPEGQDEGRGR